jgi:glucokinase
MPDRTEAIPRSQAEPPFYLGVDVGGTGIKFGIVDDNGATLGRSRIDTHQERGPEDACQRMQSVSRQLAAECEVDFNSIVHVGLATPGTMDLSAGMLLQPHNLPDWWEFPIRDHLQGILEKPVAYQNDANAAAYGEYWVGSAADFGSMVLFTLGTGVGGGIIFDGKLIDGEHSHGSECGHTYIASGPGARMCGCGRRGHLEAYASARAVVQRTREALLLGRQSSLATRVEAGEELTPLMIAEEAERDDRLALEVVMTTAEYLSYGAVNMMHTIDPNAIIFGGAMNFGGIESDLGRRFLDRIRQETRMRAFPSLVDKTHIDFAVLGGHAGYIGAAGVARVAHITNK